MKRIENLTKKQRQEWMQQNAVRSYGNAVQNASAVKFIVQNNSKDEIREWLKNATTTLFPGSDTQFFCSVYEFNRLTEYCNEDIGLTPAFYKISEVNARV